MEARDCLNMNTLKPAFNLLEAGYNEIINIRNAYSPNTVLLFHGYDYAISDGRGVCGKGPWLQPGLEERNIPMKLHRDVVRLFLEEFAKLLHRISKRNDRIIFVPTQGLHKEL